METRKAFERRKKSGWFNFIKGWGVDIGSGPDPIVLPEGVSATVRQWDKEDGDATFMEGVADESLDFVYSSHCIEHLDFPEVGLRNWYRILKPGGYLLLSLPHRDLYEKKKHLPSSWNFDHRTMWLPDRFEGPHTFSIRGLLLQELPGAQIISITEEQTGWRDVGASQHSDGEYSIEVVVRKPAAKAVSFCITCKDRLHRLKQTLPQNLKDNPGEDVEFVLLDYSSEDGLEGWVRENMMGEIQTGRLVFFAARGQKWFHMAHAKNCAHRLAQGEILVNLDADNFTGEGFSEFLKSHSGFDVMAAPDDPTGSHGRVCVKREVFNTYRGYDEDFDGYGWDDNDLVDRIRVDGNKVNDILPKQFRLCIGDKDDRSKNYPPGLRDLKKSNAANEKASWKNIVEGKTTTNLGRSWGSITVQKNFGEFVAI